MLRRNYVDYMALEKIASLFCSHAENEYRINKLTVCLCIWMQSNCGSITVAAAENYIERNWFYEPVLTTKFCGWTIHDKRMYAILLRSLRRQTR